jgi:predicted HTH domain antitoxin
VLWAGGDWCGGVGEGAEEWTGWTESVQRRFVGEGFEALSRAARWDSGPYLWRRLCWLELGGVWAHARGVTLNLPSPLEESLSPQAAVLHLAIGLYVSDETSLGLAASIAGLTHGDFMAELHKRKIPLNYDAEDLAMDLKAVEELMKK